MREPLPSAGSGPRFLSLVLPSLPTDRLLRERRRGSGAPPDAGPLVVIEKIRNAMRVVALDGVAEARGLRVGVTLADARGAVPDLDAVEADAEADAALLLRVLDWCDRYTPLVALDPPDGLVLDITGCAHLFAPKGGEMGGGDGEAALMADALRRLTRQGFSARAAIASTAGAAWGVARYGAGGAVPRGGEAEAIAELPVAALRIAPETRLLLDQLGLKRIGQLIGKPRAPLAARFGTALVTRLDQALGHRDEVLSPRRPAPSLTSERLLAEPVADSGSLLTLIASLAKALAGALERQGLGARLVEAAFFRTDGVVARIPLRTAAPLRDPATLAALFAERLEAVGSDLDAGFGFDMLRLAVLQAEPFAAAQLDLAGEEGPAVAHLADRLGARLGTARVLRHIPVDTHIPERSTRAEPVAAASATAAPAWAMPEPDASTEVVARPLRLFARPEPAEVIATVPDGPPARFRWRRVMHEVVRAEGPERIAPEWWRDPGATARTRDYFRIEDASGRRYWLFREGLYDRETGEPAWYVHGLFA